MRLEFGELRVRGDFGRDTSRALKAGRQAGLRRRVRVPAPEQKEGAAVNCDDDLQAEGVAKPARGEYEGSRADAAATCIGGSACFVPSYVRAPFRYPSEHQSHATVATIAALALVMTGRFPASGIGRAVNGHRFLPTGGREIPHW